MPLTFSSSWVRSSDFREQHTGAVGLGHEVVAARRTRPGFILAHRVRRDRDDWHRTQCWVGFEAACRLVAVHDRQLDVHQDEIRPLLRRLRQCLLSVIGLDQLVARRKQITENLHVVLFVLDQQNALPPGELACSTKEGISNVKTEP